jgi:hypothetical protein
VNALHRKVAVSLGGPNFELHRQKAIDRVVTMLPKGDPQALLNEGTQIESFSRGWKRGYLGTCTPGRPVSLAVHGASECARTSLRVCEGVYGCNGPGADGATPAYFLREKDGACQASPLTFTCPNSGTYGVMTKPEAAEIALHPSGGGAYPALEQDVFSYVEGAFFGNLFDPDGLTHFREVVLREGHLERRGGPVGGTGAEDDEDTVPHRHMYACFSLGVQEESSLSDEQGTAYLNDRVCAKPDAKKRCFPNPPKRCHFLDARKNEEVGYHCKWLSDIGAYESCRSDDGVSYVPATVRLHDPCSLIDNKELCDAIHGPPPVPR